MIELYVVLFAIVVVPIMAYLSVKLGRLGYLQANKNFQERDEHGA